MTQGHQQRTYAKPRDMPVEFQYTRPLTEHEIHCVRQIAAGKASGHEQQAGLAVITKILSGAYDIEYVTGDDRASAFRGGRSFVGKEIIKLIKTDMDTLLGGQQNG